ncbi:PREDICTED: voltage-dependent anion-selective channel protein 2-like [Rhagoletis zephyria]|uniref:voltage-dependent anion-selective channel protein 2-like n=1 Tax=Rhagoletis zephyria TaxID=28612 RepID=UPI0008116A8C|nr:PREDICTED: voltage-dependent anion-selective channel protein 2-like [Rhagoletis zephyria]
MAPPTYGDLGKQARDIFSKNYHVGAVKLDLKTKTSSNVEFAVAGTSINDTGRVNASFETKYLFKDWGCTLKEKWTTDNTILTEVSFQDQLVKGSKILVNANIAPQSGKKTGAVKTSLKGECFNTNVDFDFDSLNNGTVINGSLVLGHQGWLAGANLSFNPQQGKLNKTNFALGYQDKDIQVHTNVSDGKEFLGSLYQKINKNLDGAISVSCTTGNSTPIFSLGGLYRMDEETQIKARINNKNMIGLAFVRTLRPGIAFTLNAIIDGKNFNQGGHKLGMGIDLEA